jgi:hypothetical protein
MSEKIPYSSEILQVMSQKFSAYILGLESCKRAHKMFLSLALVNDGSEDLLIIIDIQITISHYV